ncbi:MAG: hypothetical protein HYT61_00555 [Candidatus Yanofskybacteria bacterium]|nr:hypothetical protein [Candidatus Yanofskybacteria bacterium]
MWYDKLFKYRRLIYSAIAGLVFFGAFQLLGPIYYRIRQKELAQNLRAQIYNLQKLSTEGTAKIKKISETKKILADITKNSRRLSLDVLSYEKSYLALESLSQYYNYRQEFGDLLPKILEYNPENDLNSRSVSENKGDFMYRLSLTQYALKQITIRLKKYDDTPELANYTKKITAHFQPIIDLVDKLVEATNRDQFRTSNQLRLKYIQNIKQLQSDLRPLYEQVLKELDQINQKLLAEIKI